MRELKLKYVVQLLSNLDTKSGTDAKAMVEAQKRVQDALDKTTMKVGRLESVLLKVAGLGTANAERQAMYLARLAIRYDQAAKSAERYAVAAQRVAAVGAGVGAAGYVLNAATQRPIEYSTRLAQMANTAYADRNVAGRISGKQSLDGAIRSAVSAGGGSRDAAAEALDSIIASGAMTPEQAIRLLPRLMKASTASGASPTELGMIGVRSAQSFRIPMELMDQVLNEAMAAGQAGGFELRDMAKWLPQAMAAGGTAGMGGMGDMRRLLASMQAGVTTAGTKDEAGNNLVNLLAKINSRDTANDFEKQGIDLTGRLAKARGQGVNALDAFVGLVDEVASRDRDFIEAKRKLAAAGTQGEKADAAQAMVQLLQGRAVGQVIQDRQALMALVAELGQRDYIQSTMRRMQGDTGAINTAFGVMSQETGFAKQQAANAKDFAIDDAFSAGKPVFDAFFDSVTKVQLEFPTLAAAMAGLTVATGTAAAGLGTLGLLAGGKGAAGVAGTVAGTVGAGATAAGAWVAGKSPMAARLGGGLSAALSSRLSWMRAGTAAFAIPAALELGKWSGLAPETDLKIGNEAWDKEEYFKASRYLPAGELFARWFSKRNPAARGALPPGPGGLGAPDIAIPGMTGGLSLGQGKLDVAVRVTDERVTATAQVAQPMSLVKINPGNTNPGSYQ